MHALSAPVRSLKRAKFCFTISSFVRSPVQQGIPIMSPVMVKELGNVSSENDLGPFVHRNLRRLAQLSLHVGTSFESLFAFDF